jgi:hypothetical protein
MRAGFLELDCLLMGGIVVCRCDEEGNRAMCRWNRDKTARKESEKA